MTKITQKQKDVAKVMSLVAVIGIFITATGTEAVFAFNLSENTQPTIQKTFTIAAEESSDCDEIGQWNQYRNVCVIDNKTVVGVTIKVIVQQNAVLEVPNTAILTVYGTVENNGTVDNQGQILNHGTVENSRVINNNGGTIENYWGKIVNNEGALLVNGGYMYDGQIGLRFIGIVDNHYGTIQNNGTISNHSTVNNHWGLILNNCLGSVVGTGHVSGNDIKQMECIVVVEMDRLQE